MEKTVAWLFAHTLLAVMLAMYEQILNGMYNLHSKSKFQFYFISLSFVGSIIYCLICGG
ncbi:MAG TPA: hypothetical protein PLP33_24695 [Leptospiraceae bacterium]|nr:hypothetical protein [Leptospiraceae bacterium]